MNNPAESPDTITLTVVIDSEDRKILIDTEMLENAEALLQKMDLDMDRGWQLGRDFIDAPSTTQRCQIAADRLLTALHTGSQASVLLMSTYIVSRMPEASAVNISANGEVAETQFYDDQNRVIR